MPCHCGSDRVAYVSGKTDDRCFVELGNKEKHDYVPSDMNIGGGDYLKFYFCLDCGKIQGKFPLPQTKMEALDEQEEI